ncbi:hypothetical protein ACVWYO_004050 [Sphingomonas sp. UYP23]
MAETAFLYLAVGAALVFLLAVAAVAIDDALRDWRHGP